MSPIEFQRKRINDEAAAAASDAARLANEIQAAGAADGMAVKRSEALLEAERIQAKFGLGWSLVDEDPRIDGLNVEFQGAKPAKQGEDY